MPIYIYILFAINVGNPSAEGRLVTLVLILYIYIIYTLIHILSLYKSVITNKHRPITPIIYIYIYIYYSIIIIYVFRQSTISVYYNKAFIINYTSITVYVTLEDCLNPRILIRKVRYSNPWNFSKSGFRILLSRANLYYHYDVTNPATMTSMVLAMYNILSHPEPHRTPEL